MRCNIRCSGEKRRLVSTETIPPPCPEALASGKRPTYMWVQFLARTIERRRRNKDGSEEIYFYTGIGQDYWSSFGKGHFAKFPDVQQRGGERRFLLPLSPSSDRNDLVWGVDTVHRSTPEYGGRRTVGGTPPPFPNAADNNGGSNSSEATNTLQCAKGCMDLSKAAMGERNLHEMWDAPQPAWHLLLHHRKLLNDDGYVLLCFGAPVQLLFVIGIGSSSRCCSLSSMSARIPQVNALENKSPRKPKSTGGPRRVAAAVASRAKRRLELHKQILCTGWHWCAVHML